MGDFARMKARRKSSIIGLTGRLVLGGGSIGRFGGIGRVTAVHGAAAHCSLHDLQEKDKPKIRRLWRGHCVSVMGS